MALLSIAGIPPLAGFFGKYYLLLHAQEQGLYGLVIAALMTSLVSTYYYLRLIKIFWFENGVGVREVTCGLSKAQRVSLFVFECVLILFILFSASAVSSFDFLTMELIGMLSVGAILSLLAFYRPRPPRPTLFHQPATPNCRLFISLSIVTVDAPSYLAFFS